MTRPRRNPLTAASGPDTAGARRRARALFKKLAAAHPDAGCALHHRNPYELIVATVLSAQCTDERVNLVTPHLFRAYPTPRDLAAAPPGALEDIIHSTGFFRAKARNLRGLGRVLDGEFGGVVPDRMASLLRLPGVARKTANVVLSVAYGKADGVVVDTHVKRLASRMGLTRHQAPDRVERDLMDLFPRRDWIHLSHVLIFHGRRTCVARRPRCDACPVRRTCPHAASHAAGSTGKER